MDARTAASVFIGRSAGIEIAASPDPDSNGWFPGGEPSVSYIQNGLDISI